MPKSTVDVPRLAKAISAARLVLHQPREMRARLVRLVAGPQWSEETSRDKRQPLNLIDLYTTIVGRSLIAKAPRFLLSTFQRNNKPAVATMQSWVNTAVEDMHLAETLRRVVLDALYGPCGILKVALATPADSMSSGWNTPVGRPFADRIDLDDFVFDVHARDMREVDFIGHRLRVRLETIRDSKLYSKDRKDLSPMEDRAFNEQGDERVSVIGRSFYANQDEYSDFVNLWEIYLPSQRKIVTLACEENGSPRSDIEPLRVVEWLGPNDGPIHILTYKTVPGNALGKGPVQDLVDLHESVNVLYRKIRFQGENQKIVGAVQGTASEDANRIINASDRQFIRVDNPDKIRLIEYPGASAESIALGNHLKDLFDFMAGGLSIQGGLAPQSKTLGQDRMLNENASAGVTSMQEDTTNFVAEVGNALCWYWWHDPVTTMASDFSVPGLPSVSIRRQVTPQQRQQTPWHDLQVKVDPYSLRTQTPQQRLAGLMQMMQTVIMPMQPLLQQQGISVDLHAFLQKAAAYMDSPDLTDILSVQEPPAEALAPRSGENDKPKMPQETTRNYVRHSAGADNPTSRNADLMNSLLSSKPTNGEPQ